MVSAVEPITYRLFFGKNCEKWVDDGVSPCYYGGVPRTRDIAIIAFNPCTHVGDWRKKNDKTEIYRNGELP